MNNAKPLRILLIDWKSPQKIVRLSDGQILTVSVSSCVGDKDEILERDGGYYVPCENGEAQLLPLYLKSDTLRCGGIVVPLKVKELETEQEYDSFKQLSEFHYRGHRLHGRTSVLIATTEYPLLPAVLGYIQLATPFFMNKCRSELVNAPFEAGNIKWSKWDKNTSSKRINVFVRIARTVVHPEFRGLGLGQLLIRHAKGFAYQHWHVANLKPLFLEIVADMLKFVPFSERAGMHFIGLNRGQPAQGRKGYGLSDWSKEEGASRGSRKRGLRRRCRFASSLHEQRHWPKMRKLQLKKDEFSTKLESLMDSVSLKDYEQLQSIIRLPKPTFLCAVRPETEQFVEDRLAKVRPMPPNPLQINSLRPLNHSITFAKLSVHYTSFVARTKKTQTVQKAFGVTPGSIKATVIKNLDFTIKPKEVVLIAGASGSGKTTLIELLMDRGQPRNNMLLDGVCFLSKDATVGMLQPIRSKLPIVQLVGGNDTHRALHALNIAGLTEAFLYFKKFDELSAGQKYRFMLARLIDSGVNLWLADEFCSTLDEVTASIVAHNLQRHARRVGATVIVAAPHFETFIRSLKPDRVLKLTSAWEWQEYSGNEFVSLAAQSRLQEKAHASAAAS